MLLQLIKQHKHCQEGLGPSLWQRSSSGDSGATAKPSESQDNKSMPWKQSEKKKQLGKKTNFIFTLWLRFSNLRSC